MKESHVMARCTILVNCVLIKEHFTLNNQPHLLSLRFSLKDNSPVTGSQCQVFLPSKHTIYVKYEVKVSYLKTFTNKTITNLDRSKRAFRSMLECKFLSVRPFY